MSYSYTLGRHIGFPEFLADLCWTHNVQEDLPEPVPHTKTRERTNKQGTF